MIGQILTLQLDNGQVVQGYMTTCAAAGCTTYRDTGAGCRRAHLADGQGTAFATVRPQDPPTRVLSPDEWITIWPGSVA